MKVRIYSILNMLKPLFSNPIVVFALGMIVFCFLRFNRQTQLQTIRSDARGYYAYLPAMFVYSDPTYEKSVDAELSSTSKDKEPQYLVESKEGQVFNKYFPGVALLQAPFFALATGVSWLTGNATDGYTYYYQLFFELGGLFYALLGMFLLAHFLARLYPEWRPQIKWMLPLLYFATPLFHYSINTLSFSHGYSIALFSLFGILCLKLLESGNLRNAFFLGVILGLIFLVRPTNVLIVLIVPYILKQTNFYVTLRNEIVRKKAKVFGSGMAGFFSMVGVLCLIRWWDAADPFLWSYPDEGFTFMEPHILDSLFSFRAGLFIHTPILFLVFIAWIVFFKKHLVASFFWGLYFLINLWVIASWWCWDYETAFGLRPFAEHFVFLILPIFPLLKRAKHWVWSTVVLFSILGAIRVYTMYNGSVNNQRFTAENYFTSLFFWKEDHAQRWQYTRSCEPFGTLEKESVIFQHDDVLIIKPNDLTTCAGEVALTKPRSRGRHYFRVRLDKRVSTVPFTDALLVIEASNENNSRSYRYPVPLYNDKLEALNHWKPLVFEGVIPDSRHQFSKVTARIENHEKSTLELRNVVMKVMYFKSVD